MALVLLVTVACAGPPRAAVAPLTEGSAAELVRELADFLTRDPLSVEDVVQRLGAVEEGPVRLKPRHPQVVQMRLARYPEGYDGIAGAPYTLEVVFTPEGGPLLAELQQVLGGGGESRVNAQGERVKVFAPRAPGARWSVVAIAALADSARVARVTFRRDPAR